MTTLAYEGTAREHFSRELETLRQAGIFKEERYIHSAQGAEIDVEFPAGSPPRRVINMCSNNYLGLSSHPEVIAAAHEGLDVRGYGLSSVRFICGTQDIHRELERRLTSLLGTEDTLLFPSCMDANAGVFEALLSDQDVMIADRLVHASIVDGMRLCKAMPDTFKHSDMAHLEEKLQEHQDRRFRMVITDGVFSMDGDLAKLDEIVPLAEKYHAMVLVDDSHATGFIGRTGRGTHEEKGVIGRIDLITTTLNADDLEALEATFQAIVALRFEGGPAWHAIEHALIAGGWDVRSRLMWVAEARRGRESEQGVGVTKDEAYLRLQELTRIDELTAAP